MSITTRRGDAGETDLLFGGRVPKSHPRLTAVGSADELNATLGLARREVRDAAVLQLIVAAQRDLIAIMGELSAGPAQAARYRAQGFAALSAESLETLSAATAALEARFPDGFGGWSTPGEHPAPGAAWLELARTVCRRAERDAVALTGDDAPVNAAIIPWLNRLSDALWLAARAEEQSWQGQPGQ